MSQNFTNEFNFQFMGSRIKMLTPLAPLDENGGRIDYLDNEAAGKSSVNGGQNDTNGKSSIAKKGKKIKY